RPRAAGEALGDDDDQLDARLDRLEHRVAGEPGRDGDDGAVDAHRGGDVAHAVVHRHAVDVASGAAGSDAADDPRAVVEALPGEIHRLAAGDPLDDDGGVLVGEDGHATCSGRPP